MKSYTANELRSFAKELRTYAQEGVKHLHQNRETVESLCVQDVCKMRDEANRLDACANHLLEFEDQ